LFKTITIWNKTCLFPISEWWVTLFSKIYQIFRIYWHISLLVSVYISIIPMRLTKEHTFWKYMYLLNLKFVRDTHVRWSKVITSARQIFYACWWTHLKKKLAERSGAYVRSGAKQRRSIQKGVTQHARTYIRISIIINIIISKLALRWFWQ